MANDKDFLLKNAVEVGGSTKVTLGSITSSDIDLATGNYFAETLAADTTYTLSNAGGVQSFQLEVTGGAGDSYSLGSASYSGLSFGVGSQDGTPTGIVIKPDGTKMFTTGRDNDKINEYSLSTPFDVSTASFVQNTANGDTNSWGLYFKPDGTKFYVGGRTADTIREYTLSTAWDLSSSSLANTFSISGQEGNITDVTFKPDGTKMYIVGDTKYAHEYDLSTDWDVSSASYLQEFNLTSFESNPASIEFNADGTQFLIVGLGTDTVQSFDLSTAWDITSASSTGVSFDISSQETSPYAMTFANSGLNMYVLGAINDTVYQYDTGADASITWPSSIEWAGGVAPSAPANGQTDVFTLVTDDGGTSYIGVKTADNLS